MSLRARGWGGRDGLDESRSQGKQAGRKMNTIDPGNADKLKEF